MTVRGALLRMVAGIPLPIVVADRLAARVPAQPLGADSSPILTPITAPKSTAAAGSLLDGDVVIKDQIDVAGVATGIGLLAPGPIAERDATIVARVRAAGGRIVGKAKMTELGIDGIGSVMHHGMPHNPSAPGYAPGGSSTGSAVAVASGLARYAIGGDGLGSIRIPAAFCGLVGLKPSRDRIPRDGIRAPVRTLDAVGPITRSVDDCARLWYAMVDEPYRAPNARVPRSIAIVHNRARMNPARVVGLAFDRALAALNVATESIELGGLATVTFLGGMIGAHEVATGPYAGRATTPAGRVSAKLGRSISTADADELYRRRDALRDTTKRVLDRHPIIALPTTAVPPPALTSRLARGAAELYLLRALGAYTPLANLTDLPAIAVPCGVDERGRPLSIMFVAAHGQEAALLDLAAAVEQTALAKMPLREEMNA